LRHTKRQEKVHSDNQQTKNKQRTNGLPIANEQVTFPFFILHCFKKLFIHVAKILVSSFFLQRFMRICICLLNSHIEKKREKIIRNIFKVKKNASYKHIIDNFAIIYS
jgi:hypothetical protein